MVHNNDDAMNKIPLKSANGLEDEEKNGGEFIHDAALAEEARREQMRVNILKWMKKLTIGLICFIGAALIFYVIISLCFSDWPKSSPNSSNVVRVDGNATSSHPQNGTTAATTLTDQLRDEMTNNNNNNQNNNNNNVTASTIVTTAQFATTLRTSAAADSSAVEQMTEITSQPAMTPTPSTTLQSATPATAAIVQGKVATLHDVHVDGADFQSKLGIYKNAAICSDKEVCSQIGSNMLEQGGNVVDAAIAALLCNGIVTMHSMGIGGGMLMNIYIKDNGHAYSIDARELSPYAAVEDMFDDNVKASIHGGLAIAVPGELMGYHRAHERFGKLPWNVLVQPSIEICHDGFHVSQHQWDALQLQRDHLKDNQILWSLFFNATTNEPHPIGTKLKPHKELCQTYEMLAKNGPLDFYNGTLARLVAEDLKDLGSIISADDLESYAADFMSSITMPLGNDTLYAVPPISSSIVVAHILSGLESFNFSGGDLADASSEATTIHRFVEAFKYGYAKRWELGDLRFNDIRELVSKLTNPEYNMNMRNLINDSVVRNDVEEYGAQYGAVNDLGTSPLVIVAPNGDAISVTSSINALFGAGHAGKRTGIIFNSAMNDFSIAGRANLFGLPSAPTNFIEPQKRPMSSMSPILLANADGDVHLAASAAGGPKIISALVQVIARVLWFGQDIKTAIDAPRFHHQLIPNILEYEKDGFTEEVIKMLEAKGHKTKAYTGPGSIVCGIVRNSSAIYANADYRKHGGLAGF